MPLSAPNTAALIAVMERYFFEEKAEALLFLIMGALALAVGFYFAWRGADREFGRGLLIPLALIALIQLAVGGSVYFRTDAQLAGLIELIRQDQAAYLSQELPRMETVNFWFDVYKVIEIVLLVTGVGLFWYGRRGNSSFWRGVGLGLVVQSAIMLGLDFVAEARAEIYTEAIRRFGS